MKKLFSVLLAILLVIGISVPAFADIDTPYFKEYQVRVINKNGAPFIYGDTVVPYDTVLTVTGDYVEDDGTITLSVEYNDDWGSILSTDVILLEDGVHYSEGTKSNTPQTYMVYGEGVYLYNGPGFGYKVISDEIPVGTEFSCIYYLDNSYDCAWAYATINGVSGWIYVYPYGSSTSGIVFKVTEYSDYGNDLYVFDENAEIIDKVGMDSQVIANEIPVGTRLEFEYYIDAVKSIFVLVEYNGVKGWIEADASYNGPTVNSVAISKTQALVFNSGKYPVYSVMGDDSSEIIGYIESPGIVKTLYSCKREYESKVLNEEGYYDYYRSDWFGVEVDGNPGWINLTNDWDGFRIWNFEQYITVDDDVKIYNDENSDDEIIGTVPNDTDVVVLYYDEAKNLICYNGITGWVYSSSIDRIPSEENEEYYVTGPDYNYSAKDYFSGRLTPEFLKAVRLGEDITFEIEDEPLEVPSASAPITVHNGNSNSSNSSNSSNGGKKFSFSAKQLIALCGAGVAIVVATAAVTIVLINKKKKQ